VAQLYLQEPSIFLSQIRDPQPGGPGPLIYIPRNTVVQLYPQALGSLFLPLATSRATVEEF
jgi:hypothetical protein